MAFSGKMMRELANWEVRSELGMCSSMALHMKSMLRKGSLKKLVFALSGAVGAYGIRHREEIGMAGLRVDARIATAMSS